MKQDFEISLAIYDREKILQAIEDFQEVSIITLQEEKLSISADSNEQRQEIFHEFMNYVLSL